MKKAVLRLVTACMALLVVASVAPVLAFAQSDGVAEIPFTDEEQALILRTQNGEPITIGIIPHTFPLSECPPEYSDYTGINVEMLALITQKTGLRFTYCRVPIEKNSPYESLKANDFTLVAGTIKLDAFLQNPELILSDRLCDGSAVCIAKRDTAPNTLKSGKIAVMNGYQAGIVFAEKLFPNLKIVLYPNNEDVLRAVRSGHTDLAMISRYVGIYQLQNPLNEYLVSLEPYQMVADSCVMGLNTPETQTAISIINKALSQIGEDEYSHVQMNFSITHPYRLVATQFLFKYRYILLAGVVICLLVSYLIAKLLYSQKERFLLSRDELTGAFSEVGFELAVSKAILKPGLPLFITDFDIQHFSRYNELCGKQKGDELLKNIVTIVRSFLCEQDIICRSYADNFKALTRKDSLESLIADIQKATALFGQSVDSDLVLHFGIYPVTDHNIPIVKMLDFAAVAKKTVKNNSQDFIGVYDEKLHKRLINDARMLSSFDSAIENKEFIAYYQPKFDVTTKEIIGAEALVRWRNSDGSMIPPMEFIELFEKNGQIRRLDFYMLKRVCEFQQKLMLLRLPLVAISVNFSRVHLHSSDFTEKVNQIVERFGVPKHLIEIECTETTMTNDVDLTKSILGSLQAQGFSISMDDFGKAYSSLNTLCAIPLDIVKLDSGFLLAKPGDERERARKIIRGVVSLVHDLSLHVIAEGVETEEQYDFLKSVGCDSIQGYYFSRPLDEASFFKMLTER